MVLGIFPCLLLDAHQPLLEPPRNAQQITSNALDLQSAVSLGDPTRASVAMYGHLSNPNEIDLYRFEPVIDDEIPVELLVPVRLTNASFRPWMAILSPALPPASIQMPLPFAMPEGWRSVVISGPDEQDRPILFEPFSLEHLYRGREMKVPVQRGQIYYVAVFDPAHFMGSYSLTAGSREDFTDVSVLRIAGNILRIKLGIFGVERPVWLDYAGTLLFFGGCFLGLAIFLAPSVGFPAFVLSFFGALMLYRSNGFSGVATFQFLLAIPLLVLTFFAKRYWVRALLMLLWILELLLLLWYLLVLR